MVLQTGHDLSENAILLTHVVLRANTALHHSITMLGTKRVASHLMPHPILFFLSEIHFYSKFPICIQVVPPSVSPAWPRVLGTVWNVQTDLDETPTLRTARM